MKHLSFGILILFALLNSACAQSKIEKIDKLLSACAEYGRFNGSVLIAEKGKVIYKKGFGLANMEWNVPNQVDTKFRLASISKQFTAMLILQLVAEGKLQLDVPISTYLPDYPEKNASRITIHHLLTHTSGIPNYTSFPTYRDMMLSPHKPSEIVDLFADAALEFTPGEKFAYSNSGYVLLGALIEKATGKTFEKVLQEKIFTPLKMNNSGYDRNSPVIKNRAAGYYRNGNAFVNANYIDMSTPYAAGALYSTVEDLYLWDRALYTEKLLPKKYMDLLFEKHTPGFGNYYGYGWEIGAMRIGSTKEEVQTISHSGTINGFNTQITRIPSDQSLIVLLNNTGGAPLYDMTTDIIGILRDKPYNFPKKSMAYALAEVVEQDGAKAMLSYYEKMKGTDHYYLNEDEMNTSGYHLLQAEKVKEAAAIFKFNVEAFPKSFNVYDSYGEVLLVLGDTAQAIDNYKKSISINPGNKNGLKVLKELGVNTDSLIVKVPVEHLRLLAGEYMVADQNREWKIVIEETNGELFGNDQGYRYQLNPVGDDKFINPDDGATLEFDVKDKNAISFVIFGKFKFNKVK